MAFVVKIQNDSLCHYGRLGQKWGVRRYQNLDGSLTPEGRERYGQRRSEYGLDVKDRGQLTEKQRRMQEKAATEYLTAKKFSPNITKNDAEIRKYAEETYKTIATIERGRAAIATAVAAVGGTVISGGNPVGGAASAILTAALNSKSEITRPSRTVEYANTLAIGKEVCDKFMKDVDIYTIIVPNNKRPTPESEKIPTLPGQQWNVKRYKK